MHLVIRKSVEYGINPQELMKITGEKRWIWVEKECRSKEDFDKEEIKNVHNYDDRRWFNKDDELLVYDGRTYAFSNQQGRETHDLVKKIFDTYPQLNGSIELAESSSDP
jgi:hypothetical protein